MTDVRRQLLEHVRRGSRERFSWGSANCWFWVADWVAFRTGRDPAAVLRGRFSTRFGLLRVLVEEGERDFIGMAATCFARIGLVEIPAGEVRLGDIAGLRDMGGADVGAISTGRGFVGRGEGIWWVREAADVLAAWRIEG